MVMRPLVVITSSNEVLASRAAIPRGWAVISCAKIAIFLRRTFSDGIEIEGE